MQGVWSFIKSKQFLLHFSILLAVLVLCLFVTSKALAAYTDHGESVAVPDFKGKTMAELDAFVKGKDVGYKIIDSIYDPKGAPGVVIRQDPEPDMQVKHNRTVYLYVTGMVPPQIKMPKLVDRSERQARLIIETYGLRVGRITEREADCNGCVLSQSVRGKGEVEAGKDVKKGSIVDLEIGRKGNLPEAAGADSTAEKKEELNFDGNDHD